MDALELARSRTYPVGVARAFDTLLPLPLPQLFARRYAALPAIREVRDHSGDPGDAWGTVGQSRTIVLADRSTMRETLTSVERPDSFGYRIDQVHGPLRPLASSIDGRWSFEKAGTGVRITWTWSVRPTSAATALLMPSFGRMWQGYARQALERLEDLLLT
ncbi:SRPBCC family protein [Nocardioides sp. YIM 152315]|uniref:SRPBCC family protein n=1 Tax=Nocardioides sp. YIM 152315 TaxID=3031760 RepID=UPI0023DC3346|nr:SRPBCC family protein [Nocardioides sp. YIM 152315]MDF1605916.1 SRPBCC family protein [Nocardioides sp. YIM 152315]